MAGRSSPTAARICLDVYCDRVMPKGLIITAIAVCLSIVACQDDTKIMEVTVGPELVDCVGSAPMKCMEVDGQLFYESIEGFTHEGGYTYKLKIEQYDAFPGKGEPPQSNAVSHGCSPARFRDINVINTGRV